jgi:hypothetical protein
VQLHAGNAARDQRRVRHRGRGAERHIDPLGDQVDHPVREHHLDRALRVLPHELRGQIAEVRDADDINGRRHPEVPAGRAAPLAHGERGLVEPRERARDPLPVRRADLGQRDPAGRALDELDAELLLEAREPPAHRGLRQREPPRGRREAAVLRHPQERADLLQVRRLGLFRSAQHGVAS